MQYNYGQVYVFPVIHPEGANDNFIYLQCENSSGELVEVRLPRLMFQKTPGYSTPEMLGCRVKGTSADGTPILSHDIVQYVKEIYGAPEQQGEIYDFTVVVPSQDGNEYMSVIDRHGIIYRVKRPETPVRKGQRVKGHFYTAKNGYLNLTLVRESAHFPFFRFDEVCEALGMDAVERNRRQLSGMASYGAEGDAKLHAAMVHAGTHGPGKADSDSHNRLHARAWPLPP